MNVNNEPVEKKRFTFAERGKFHKYLSVIDLCVCSFIIAPLTIAYWSSTWRILAVIDERVVNKVGVVPAAVTAIGFLVSFTFTALQKQIKAVFTTRVNSEVLYFLGSRSYTYAFAFASVCIWYGLWWTVDALTHRESTPILATLIVFYVGLILTRTSRNVNAAPFVVVIDDKKDYFDAPTYFQSLQNAKGIKLILLDLILSVLTTGTLGAVIWRASWFLLDEIILKFEEKESSNFCSLIIGYFIALVAYFLQSPVESLIKKTKGWTGMIILDIYIFFLYCGSINVWYGVWNSIVLYTKLEQYFSICISIHFGSFLILAALRSSNTLPIRGAASENMDSVEECVQLPKFFRSRLHWRNHEEDVDESCTDKATHPKDTTNGTKPNNTINNECKSNENVIICECPTTKLDETSVTIN